MIKSGGFERVDTMQVILSVEPLSTIICGPPTIHVIGSVNIKMLFDTFP